MGAGHPPRWGGGPVVSAGRTNDQDATGTALAALDLATRAIELAGLAARASGYAAASKAPNTRRAYGSDWAHYTTWCALAGLQALPADPGTVCLYLTAHAPTLRVSTLRRRLACIGQAHRAAGFDSPGKAQSVRDVWAGIARSNQLPVRRKTPLVVEAMRSCLDELDDTLRGRRDRCLLLFAWGGALRRSEVVALRCGDVETQPRGLVLSIRRGKTDQQGDGRLVALPYGRREEYCPVRAYHAHLTMSRHSTTPLFTAIDEAGRRSRDPLDDKHVARLVKTVCARAGLEGDYSGHSLRAGFATAAAAAGASERAIMAQTGHKSVLVMRGYIRPATLWQDNAAAVAAL